MAKARLDLGGTWECRPLDGPEAAWRPIQVPANWHLAGLPNYSGTVRYRRRFERPGGAAGISRIDAAPGSASTPPRRSLLRFRGVDYFARVWLNGRHLGDHEGYFESFQFEVTGLLEADNELLVDVSAPREAPGDWPDRKRLIKGVFQQHDCRPGAWDPERGQDEGTGGIWGAVELLNVPPVYVAGLRAHGRPGGRSADPARVAITLELDALEAGPAWLRLRAQEVRLHEQVTLRPGLNELRYEVGISEPRLWWPWDQGEPHLYGLRAEVESEASEAHGQTAVFGIRELRIADDTTWWLNGRRFFPRGTNVIPTQWLATYTEDAIERDVRLLRQANVNAIRVHAHVNRDELYAACDRAGILVWQDFALQWSYQETPDFVAEACRQIAAMGRQLYNHPSIGLWCCHNEPSVNRDSLDPKLAEALAAVDTSRPILPASDFRTHPYPGWYWSAVEEFRALPATPFVSEFGAQALPRRETLERMFEPGELWPPDWPAWAYRDFQYDQTFNVAKVPLGESLDDFVTASQRYQARLLQVAIESYRRARYTPITGLFQFMFSECWDGITWAVLEYDRHPKLGYEALKRAYQPLLPLIDLRRENAMAGGEIQAGFWIANDLPRPFDHVTYVFGLRDRSGVVLWEERRAVPEVPADGVVAVQRIEEGFSPWRAPADTPPGTYVLFAELRDANGELLAANSRELEIVARPEGL